MSLPSYGNIEAPHCGGRGTEGGREREGRIALKLKGMATDPYRDVH